MGLAFPKGVTAKARIAKVRAARQSVDRRENVKVRVRSGGRCEMVIDHRCGNRAVHVHHLLSGIGTRARGSSCLAENKLHLCESHHAEIHAHVLRPDGPRYRRVR